MCWRGKAEQGKTATAMVQSGLSAYCWDCAMEFDCCLLSARDKLADGQTASENIFAIPFQSERTSVTTPSVAQKGPGCIRSERTC